MGILSRCFGGSGSSKQPSTRIEDLCHRFSLAQLRKSTNNFDTSQIIGSGAFADVYRGSISINGEEKEIAVKRGRKAGRYADQVFPALKNEIVLMCQLHHPHLVPLIGFCNDKNEMMVVYDYMPNGSLLSQLLGRDSKSPVLSWKKRLEISIGVARGLHYLHAGTKRTIIHRDVKSINILFDENWLPKLISFGLSVKGPKFSSKAAKPVEVSGAAGSLGYIAPECFAQSLGSISVTHKCDVYSFGVVLLELICGQMSLQIFEGIKGEEVNEGEHSLSYLTNIGKQLRNFAEERNAKRIINPSLVGQIAPGCWKLYMDIVENCLSEDPNERPEMGEVEVELERALELQEEADANHESQSFF